MPQIAKEKQLKHVETQCEHTLAASQSSFVTHGPIISRPWFFLCVGVGLQPDESWHENTPIDVWVWVKTRPKRLSWHAHLLVPKVCDV